MKFKLLESNVEKDSEGNPLTPEQIKFFKNSKIRDRSGRLLVCYHGTDAEFDTFEKGDIGFHFGSAGQSASRAKYKGYDGVKNWVSIPCYLNILNPFNEEWDYGQWDWASIVETWFFGSGDGGEAEYVYDGKEPAETYIPKEFQDESSMKVLHSLLKKYKEWRLQKRPRKMVEYNSEGNTTLRNLFKAKGYDGISYVNAYEIAGGDDTAYIAFYPNQIKSITNKNPSNSNNINENIDESAITVYRVGQVNDFSNGLFFTDNLSYYDHSMTGYKKQDAVAYKLDLGKAKAIDIVNDWNLSVNTWSDIRQTEEFFDSKDFPYYEYLESVDYDDENAYHEVMTDTDSLAQWAHDNGYDVCIIRDVYDNYGKRFTEYCVYNKDLIKPLNTNSSRGRAPMTESTSPASIDEQTFKDAFSEPMNTLYGSKDMGMDVVCERLYYDYGIDATYHGATIYVGDKKLCTLRFSHEGRNLWGIYEIRTYIDGLKKVYTVHDFFE